MTEPRPADRSTDLGSEYGRLLAERDRLIAQGVDPKDLEMPMQPLDNAHPAPADESTEEALLPCPFDGDTRVGIQKRDRFPDSDIQIEKWAYFVACPSCACEGPWRKSDTGARREWNRRAAASSTEAGRLREAAQNLINVMSTKPSQGGSARNIRIAAERLRAALESETEHE